MDVPDVSYARSGDVSIAYQVFGDGPADLVFLPFLSNLYTLWEFKQWGRFCERLAVGRRIILINPRGVGLSDRTRGFTVESRVDDIRAVIDAEGVKRVPLLAIGDSAATSAVFAASYPDRVERLVLFNPVRRGVAPEDRDGALKQLQEERDSWGRRDRLEAMARESNPQWADDHEYIESFVRHHRLTSSPGTWLEFRRMTIDLDITDVLSAIRVPTLVMAKELTRVLGAEVAERIQDSQLVILPGEGLAIFENEFAIETIEAFLTGAPQQMIPDSVLVTLLFTDLVGSTARAAELGDRAWRELLKRHHEVVRRELARFRGVEVDTAGDGFFATFDGPARAIRAAEAIVDGVGDLGLDVRAGVHTGECEQHDGKIAGIAVSMGARVSAIAEPGEVLVSSTVRDLVAGSGIEFEDRGAHELKGVPGEWRLYAVSAA
ncbi:MAG: adenylate/guanylate cyclase domain-containing protein [Actinomycetota bacterium]